MTKGLPLLVLLTSAVFPQEKLITTSRLKGPPDHVWISMLTEGPTDWVGGSSYRVVVTTSEIYDHVYIEKVTYGDEGCCKRLASIRALDLKEFAQAFNLPGEISGFKFVKWDSSSAFTFSMRDRYFRAYDIQKPKVKIIETK